MAAVTVAQQCSLNFLTRSDTTLTFVSLFCVQCWDELIDDALSYCSCSNVASGAVAIDRFMFYIMCKVLVLTPVPSSLDVLVLIVQHLV